MKQIIVIILLLWGWPITSNPPLRWNLNDVSYLMPSPQDTKQADSTLLRPDSAGLKGPLISSHTLERIISQSKMRLFKGIHFFYGVSVRIDPCFHMDLGSLKCQAQVRMVWQPWAGTKLVDTAIHSFYNLTDKQFAQLAQELLMLKLSHGVPTDWLPLQIHPAIQAQGLNGPFMTGLKNILLNYCGEQNLARVATMGFSEIGVPNVAPQGKWTFSAFDYANGRFARISIPRIQQMAQSLDNITLNDYHLSPAQSGPLPSGADTLTSLITDSKSIKAPDALAAGIAAYRIQNPKFLNSNTLDCVSCHVSQQAGLWITANFPSQDISSPFKQYVYRSTTSNLQNTSDQSLSTNKFIMFGRFPDGTHVISQRTINESAEVVDQLNSPGGFD
jgi:hypothetical protein